MRYTAIALDFDGTLAHDGAVPAHVLEGLARLKATGRKLLLVTGRELDELLQVFPGIGLFDLVVAENGALLYRPGDGERRQLGEPPPAAFVEALRASGIPLSVGHTIVATVRPHETVVLAAIASHGLEQQVIFNKGAVMVLPPGCNKASGLRHALAELGLSARNLVAAGDGENDHAMLDMAEYSVATANAIAALKEVADRVTRATHGDGVLEIVAGLLDSDLATMPPRSPRRALCLGRDASGARVLLPRRRASLLVTGEASRTAELATALLERLGKAGYQFCVLDTRGTYLDFKPAVHFGTAANTPTVEEVLTGLEKPDVQAVVSLEALSEEGRTGFVLKLLAALRGLRERTGRPHWILVDESHEVLRASASDADSPASGAENLIYVTADPTALAPAILNSVDGIAACGDEAGATLDAFAASVAWETPRRPGMRARPGEALVWFRHSELPPALIEVARMKDEPRPARSASHGENSPEVGRVLRRA